MDMVAREAVGAFVDELRRDWPRVVRAFWRTTTPAQPALDESEALRVHGRAHPGRGGSAGGLGGLQPPLSWCINGNMGRVREKKRWRKEEKWRERERKKKRPDPFNLVLHPPLFPTMAGPCTNRPS